MSRAIDIELASPKANCARHLTSSVGAEITHVAKPPAAPANQIFEAVAGLEGSSFKMDNVLLTGAGTPVRGIAWPEYIAILRTSEQFARSLECVLGSNGTGARRVLRSGLPAYFDQV
ncbi:MAG: hypothetical protein M1826_001449 [Phylliscum demangeonii]|nr:MAG: hypothetical protein M1826_001449 [Phylliscum demangeonii]